MTQFTINLIPEQGRRQGRTQEIEMQHTLSRGIDLYVTNYAELKLVVMRQFICIFNFPQTS